MKRNIEFGLAQPFTKARTRVTMVALEENVSKVAHREMIRNGVKFYLRVGTIANFCEYRMPKFGVHAHSRRFIKLRRK